MITAQGSIEQFQYFVFLADGLWCSIKFIDWKMRAQSRQTFTTERMALHGKYFGIIQSTDASFPLQPTILLTQLLSKAILCPFLLHLGIKIITIYSLNSNNLNITIKIPNNSMFAPITPQKRTVSLFHNEDPALRELSPFPQCLNLSSSRKNHKLELLQSPMPTNRDLFSQLLASELKTPNETAHHCQIMEEQAYDQFDHMDIKDSSEDSSQNVYPEAHLYQEIQEESSENGIKKRKRKSTGQIKILKQELDVEPNWSKDKIVEMSDITGLSQSQVYKWWWDQKKKNAKGEKETLSKMILKRKLIRKDLSRRGYEQQKDEDLQYSIEESAIATKIKANVDLEQLQETERKINKRLVFA